MTQKITISVCLSSEELNKLDNDAKEHSMSRSSYLGKLITHQQHTEHINNTPQDHPGGIKAILNETLDRFWAKLDDSLVKDRQDIADLIKDSHLEG